MTEPLDMESLCAALLRDALVEPEALQRARRAAAESQDRIDRVLTRLGLVPERRMAESLARWLGIPVATPADYPARLPLDGKVTRRFMEASGVLPIGETDEGVVLAMLDPLDGFARHAIELALGRRVLPSVAVPADFEAALARLTKPPAEAQMDALELSGDDDVERLKDLASDAPVIRLVNQMIARAVDQRASDIHLEPFETRVRLRYRVDGVLQEQEALPRRLAPAVVSRIKIMARLDIAERRLPQDGRIKLAARGRDIDIRVATSPGLHGETVVLRLLDLGERRFSFAELGLDGSPLERLLGLLERPNGILLVTGPTGSGKTTTLYAALARLNQGDRKIITVEDPIEVQLEGVNQTQVKPEIGLGFAQVLRASLRHDPDVLMVGEIRDLETAQVAAQAALTGHLVLSTLHTNGAAASVARLLDIGLEGYLIASAVSGLMAQRLVRRLCLDCRQPAEATREMLTRLGAPDLPSLPTVWRACGCPACRGTGFAGRTAIAEVLVMDDALRAAVSRQADAPSLHRLAVAAGMRSLAEDGLDKVLAGVTTAEEVWRVTRDG